MTTESAVRVVRRAPLLALLLIFCILSGRVLAQSDPLHIWVGKLDRSTAEQWVNAHLVQERKYVDELLAVKGPRTVANTLQPYDNAQNELALSGSQVLDGRRVSRKRKSELERQIDYSLNECSPRHAIVRVVWIRIAIDPKWPRTWYTVDKPTGVYPVLKFWVLPLNFRRIPHRFERWWCGLVANRRVHQLSASLFQLSRPVLNQH